MHIAIKFHTINFDVFLLLASCLCCICVVKVSRKLKMLEAGIEKAESKADLLEQ